MQSQVNYLIENFEQAMKIIDNPAYIWSEYVSKTMHNG